MIASKKGSRAQSAMEYLMTYGWAILIIAVVLGALFQLGVFNSSSFSPRSPPGACQVFRPSGPGTVTNINLMGVCTGQLPQYVAQFNGQTSYVDVPAVAGPTGPFTVTVWANLPNGWSGSAYASLVSQGNVGDASGVFDSYFGGTAWDGLQFRVRGSDGTPYYASVVNGPFPAGWRFYTFVFDGSNLIVYVNGAQASAVNRGAITLASAATHVTFQGATAAYAALSLTNIQFYNSSLSANQIQALYLEGMGGAPMKLQNLVGWWPLNGNTKDYGGNNNNGVPTAVTFTSQYGK